MVLACGGVVSLVAVQSAKDFAIDHPVEVVRVPIDGVRVPLRFSVGRCEVHLVAVCIALVSGST